MSQLRTITPATLACALIAANAYAGADYVVNYAEAGTTTGFYDSTPAVPVGGNTGTTIGEQRRIAFEFALDVWVGIVSSPVPIVVDATMESQPCNATSGTLGQAGPTTAATITRTSAPYAGQRLYAPIGLANALAGADIYTAIDEPLRNSDIQAAFNKDVGSPECFASLSWYLGLDGNAGDLPDFLGVALHELGHGFGFTNFFDDATGASFGLPDTMAIMAFDIDAQMTWADMTATQVLASFTNPRGVVWNGQYVTAAAPQTLVKGSPRITITPEVAGLSGMVSENDGGPAVADAPVTGTLVIPSPTTGCETPTNSVSGAIVLVTPGDACHPLIAVAYMQFAGARGVLAVDRTGAWPPENIFGVLDGQTVPVLSIHQDDGAILSQDAVGSTVTLDGDATRLVGADAQSRVYLYTPNPTDGGSTAAHWDMMARKQLLMEPSRTATHVDVDLTREFMRDIGWPVCGDSTVQGTEECDDGNLSNLDGCSGRCKKEVCGDGVVNQSAERCDDANTISNDGCSATCQPEVCGDGTVNQSSEQCDDGNTAANDGCSATCSKEVCGDGAVNQTAEACDDGNTVSADGCTADCQVEPGAAGGAGSLTSAPSAKGNDGCGCRLANPPKSSLALLMAAFGMLGLVRRGNTRPPQTRSG